MGVEYFVYCPRHKELLYLGKWWHLSHLGKLPRDVVEHTRRRVSKDRPRRGPSEIRRDDRIIELLAAFLTRHNDCEMRGGSDLDRDYERKIGLQLDLFRTFDSGNDVRLAELEIGADAEKTRQYAQRLQPEVITLERKLNAGEIPERRREKTQKRIEDMKTRLRSAEDRLKETQRELEGLVDRSGRVSVESNKNESDVGPRGRQVDMVEEMKTASLPPRS